MLLGCILHYNVCTWVFIRVSHLFCIFLFSIDEILLVQTKKYLLYHTEHLCMVKRKKKAFIFEDIKLIYCLKL
jgi:hypothetical protein